MTEEGRSGFVADLAARFAAQGFPRVPAAVLMALMASEDGELGVQDLVDELAVSRAAISGAVKYLGVVGFVRTVSAPGSRRHRYALDGSWYMATLVDTGRYRDLAAAAERYASRLSGGGAERVAEMAEFFRFLDDAMPRLREEWLASRPSDRA